MYAAKSQRTGRKNNNERIRELVALLGSLSQTGDTVAIDAISRRLGISEDEARSMMNIVCQASGEEMSGLLISSNDDESEYTLQFPGTTGKPVRLTKAETIALFHALDVAGIDDDDPLRERLSEAFSSSVVKADEVRQALGSLGHVQDQLMVCARSKVCSRALVFDYMGLRDTVPRRRRVVASKIMTQNNAWYVVATDLDIGQERTFRVDRMLGVRLGELVRNEPTESLERTQRVGITFLDPLYYHAFDWPELRITNVEDSIIHGDILYYGDGNTWLLRRICAGNGCIIVDDERIMHLARKYAKSQLCNGEYPLRTP